jgi:ferredoxin-NADP reductase
MATGPRRLQAFALKIASRLPKPLRGTAEQLVRDLGMVAGEPVDPLVRRPGPPAPQPASTTANLLHARAVRVAEVVRETADAVTLVLEDGQPFDYLPGQFYTVLLDIDGQSVRRAYSASSVPLDPAQLRLTIKRIAGGLVSGFINERVHAGMTVQLLGPSGSFVIHPDSAASRELVMVAGGSGITPMMSIIRTALRVESDTQMTLVYGNRGKADIIFDAELDALAKAHPERLRIRHVLENPPASWAGGVGRLDEKTAAAELGKLGFGDAAEVFVCGPEPMMAAVRNVLLAAGVEAARIHEEKFSQPHQRAAKPTTDGASHRLTVRRRGTVLGALDVLPGKTLLETGLAAGLPMPYSCAMGGCATCMVHLVDGRVDMEEPNCLMEEERGRGFVLACVSRPLTDVAIEIPEPQ